MLIIPDANALYNDPLFRKKPALTVLERLEAADARLLLSPVVLGELKRHFLSEAMESADIVTSRLRKFERWTGITAQGAHDLIQAARSEAAARWDDGFDEITSKPNVDVAPWPSISTQKVVERELERRRPFIDLDRGTIGHRDAVIWEGVLEAAEANSENVIVFVTADKGFLGDDGLHADLLADVDELGIDREQVRVVTSFGAVLPLLRDEAIVVEGERDERRSWRLAAVSNALDRLLRDIDSEPLMASWDPRDGGMRGPDYDLGLPTDVEEWSVTVADGPSEPDFNGEVPLGEGTAVCRLNATLRFEGLMSKADWYSATGNDDAELWDSDWDDHYVVVSSERDVVIQVELAFGESDDDVESAGIVEVTALHAPVFH